MGRKWTEEQKRKLSETVKGRIKSPEHREKLRQAGLGQKHSMERRRNESLGHLGQQKGTEHHAWVPIGTVAYQRGYRVIKTRLGYEFEHRLVVEKAMGRKLCRLETVHHINEDKLDNRLENLKVFRTPGKHVMAHRTPERVRREDIVFDGLYYFSRN